MIDLVGQNLGQYEILNEIAKGGMSTVYRARQTSMNRDVAIKILPTAFMHDTTFLDRFYREVDIIARLQHPHILPVYDFGQFQEMPYIVMAYMSGGTLTDKVKRQGPLTLPEVSRVIKEIADALDYAHSKGIIHRDFKPSNVLLDEQDNTYLGDFGLAKLRESSTQITGTAILGTPTYMPPEQAGSSDLTPAADIYALGVTVFQLLTGRVPYEGNTTGVLIAHATQPIPDIRAIRATLTDETQEVIYTAMAKAPTDRYATPGDLAKALKTALEGSSEPRTKAIEEPQTALLMTNSLGQVIFVDHHCLKLLKLSHADARTVIGKSLADAVGIAPKISEQLIKDVSNSGRIDARQMTLKDSKGENFDVICSAVATYDAKKNFVGSDFTLKPVLVFFDDTKILEVPSNSEELGSAEESYLQLYFTTQYSALQKLLVQLGGKRLSDHMDSIINETAQRNVWPVKVHEGKLTIDLKSSDADIYRALLAKAITYTNSVIGERIVTKEMNTVDASMNSRILDYVKTYRLR